MRDFVRGALLAAPLIIVAAALHMLSFAYVLGLGSGVLFAFAVVLTDGRRKA